MSEWKPVNEPPPPGQTVMVKLRSGREDRGWFNDPDPPIEDVDSEPASGWVQVSTEEAFASDDPPTSWRALTVEE